MGSEPNDPIPMDEQDSEAPGSDASSPSIRAFSGKGEAEQAWQRTPEKTGKGAVHVKTFHSKLRPDALKHLDEQINDWLDQHPECEVKFANTAVGELSGKMREPALFVTVWV